MPVLPAAIRCRHVILPPGKPPQKGSLTSRTLSLAPLNSSALATSSRSARPHPLLSRSSSCARHLSIGPGIRIFESETRCAGRLVPPRLADSQTAVRVPNDPQSPSIGRGLARAYCGKWRSVLRLCDRIAGEGHGSQTTTSRPSLMTTMLCSCPVQCLISWVLMCACSS